MLPVHFVVPQAFADEVTALPDRLAGDYSYWLGGDVNWAAQSWLVLRQYRESLTIGATPKPSQVNFAHSNIWRTIPKRCGEFRIGVRADFPRLFDVDFEILQNPSVRLSPRQAYLPYWPVPGLIPRSPARNAVKTVAYAGRPCSRNLADALCGGAWLDTALDGVSFAVIPPDKWHDMSNIDVLVAIRSFDRSTHPKKPPSKLFNAWRAGVPLVAGWDSAFAAIGRPGIDYLRVSTQEEFVKALSRLRSDRAFYDRIVEAGRIRAQEVTHERIAETWLTVLEGPVCQVYEAWRERRGSRTLSHLARGTDIARNSMSRLKARLLASHGD